jgi:hypothetical protein
MYVEKSAVRITQCGEAVPGGGRTADRDFGYPVTSINRTSLARPTEREMLLRIVFPSGARMRADID